MLQVDLTSLASGASEARSADRATKSREFSSHAIVNPTKDFLENLETREGKRKHRSPRYSCASLAKRARKRLHVLHRQENDVQKGAYTTEDYVLWNKIPSEIRNLPSLNVFKTSLHGKDYLNAL